MAQKRPNKDEVDPSADAKRQAIETDDEFELPAHIEVLMMADIQNTPGSKFSICNLLVPREAMMENLTQRIEIQSQFQTWIDENKAENLEKMQTFQDAYSHNLAATDEMKTKLFKTINELESLIKRYQGIDRAFDELPKLFSELRKEVLANMNATKQKKTDIAKVYNEFNEIVQDLNEKLSDGLDVVEVLMQECLPFDEELLTLNQKRQTLEQNIKDAEIQEKKMQVELTQEREVVCNLQDKFEASKIIINELLMDNERIKTETEKLQETAEKYAHEKEEFRCKIRDMSTKCAQYEQEIERYNVVAVEKDQQIRENTVRVENLQKTIEIMTLQNSELRQQFGNTQYQCTDHETTNTELIIKNDENSDFDNSITIPEMSDSSFSQFVPLADSTATRSQGKYAEDAFKDTPGTSKRKAPETIKQVKRVKPNAAKENENSNSSSMLPRCKQPRNFLA